MSQPTSSLQLFGLDLPRLWQEFRQSWQAAGQSRALAWLTPDLPIRVLRVDGTFALWSGGRFEPEGDRRADTEFEAIEVSDDLVLRKRLRMPDMAPASITQAVRIEVQSAAPFAAGDLVWGHAVAPASSDTLRNVDVVIASRRQIAQYVEQQRHRLAAAPGQQPEVWVLAGDASPIILTGWGEQGRQRKAVQHRRAACALICSALLIAAAMAVTPSLQLRARSLEAIAAFQGLQRDTTAVVAQRDAFTRSVEHLETLRGILAEHIDMLPLMTALTNALPDTTYLQSVQVQGMKLSIHGLTADSAALMQTLSAVPGFKDVRAPMAATRAPGADAENFRIEAQLDPAVFALTASTAAPPQPGGGQTVAPDAPPDAPQASAPEQPAAAAPPSTPAGSPAPPRKSRFTIGG